MKTKILLLSALFLLIGFEAEAQLLDKLKQRAKEKGLETREVSFDSTAYNNDNNYNNIQEVELETLRDFFTTDVIMALYNKDGQQVQTSFFDADVIAMRTKQEGNPNPIYHDTKGMLYGFNVEEGHYEKMSILPASSMGFMMAGMTTQAYKLPPEPYYEAFEFLSEKDIALNFIVLELAFIYKPEHFEDDDNYTLQNITFPDVCKRFNYNDPEYQGSYIQFDEKGRLVEFNINSTNPQFTDDSKNSSGKFVYSYQECHVQLPEAIEQSMVPGPLGKMLNLERGLEPWKHNKKDKQKN
ncbi:hypothetical protein ACFO5O_03535 [Geojedonia litorea]|uniref:GLPGLI family protein n=1 Tax=Geojedonia litorea TaxID=1268269 RepID=A0ABV9MZH7_9FLAO